MSHTKLKYILYENTYCILIIYLFLEKLFFNDFLKHASQTSLSTHTYLLR